MGDIHSLFGRVSGFTCSSTTTRRADITSEGDHRREHHR
jgi:hypothetical protein